MSFIFLKVFFNNGVYVVGNKETELDLLREPVKYNDLVVNNIIKSHVIAGMTVSLVPVPLFDVAALVATQIKMLKSLCEHYHIPFDETNTKSLVIALLGGSLPFFSMVGLSSLSKFVPGVGSVVGSASLSVVAGGMTYAVGRIFSNHFMEGGTLEDFSPKQARVFLKQEIKDGEVFVRKLKDQK